MGQRSHEAYREYAAEARACGYEVETFAEWRRERNPKADKHREWERRYANDTQDLY